MGKLKGGNKIIKVGEIYKTDLHAQVSKFVEYWDAGRNVSRTRQNGMEEPREQNNYVYIVNMAWWSKWKKFTGFREERRVESTPDPSAYSPGMIDNEELLEDEEKFYISDDPTDMLNRQLKAGLKEKVDYIILFQAEWQFLLSIYGGTQIQRNYSEQRAYGQTISYEPRLMEIYLVLLPTISNFTNNLEIGDPKPILISKYNTLNDLRKRIISVLNNIKYSTYFQNIRLRRIGPKKPTSSRKAGILEKERKSKITEIHAFFKKNEGLISHSNYRVPEEGEIEEHNCGLDALEIKAQQLDVLGYMILEQINLCPEDIILVETADSDRRFIFKYLTRSRTGKCSGCYQNRVLLYPCKCEKVSYCSTECLKIDTKYHKKTCTFFEIIDNAKTEKKPNSRNGITGLQNMGNTCFMNAGLQCLSNTYELTQYFLKDIYKKEINKKNTLGMGGKFVISYAKLMKEMWYDDSLVVRPTNIKKLVSTLQPTFCGYQQQDSLELISFVLDGLHEDVNRVEKKPVVKAIDWTDPKDDSICSSFWENHLKRNQSVIVDLMHGLFKSTLLCPECKEYSITFDPFSFITLPIPKSKVYNVQFYYLPYKTENKPTGIVLHVSDRWSMEDLRVKISSLFGVRGDGFLIEHIFDNKLVRMMNKESRMEEFNEATNNRGAAFFIYQINEELFEDVVNTNTNTDTGTHMKNPRTPQVENANAVSPPSVSPKSNGVEGISGISGTSGTLGISGISGTSGTSGISPPNKLFNRRTEFVSPPKAKGDKQPLGSCPEPTVIDDYNNSLPTTYLKVPLHFDLLLRDKRGVNVKEVLSFPRVLYFHRSWKLSRIYLEIFKYVFPFIQSYAQNNPKKAGDLGLLTESENFRKVFPDIERTYMDYRHNYYTLLILNDPESGCLLCLKKGCEGCFLEYSERKSLEDVLRRAGVQYTSNSHMYEGSMRKKDNFELVIQWHSDLEGIRNTQLTKCSVHPKSVGRYAYSGENDNCTLADCLQHFHQKEQLKEDNAWYCGKCKRHVCASKEMEIAKLPKVLILNLKRFKMSRYSTKLTSFVDYPVTDLDMAQYIIGPHTAQHSLLYDLYAVVIHYGGMGGGHYIAYALNPIDLNWYEFNDSRVNKIDIKHLVTKDAYVLFYRLKETKDPANIDYSAIMQKIDL